MNKQDFEKAFNESLKEKAIKSFNEAKENINLKISSAAHNLQTKAEFIIESEYNKHHDKELAGLIVEYIESLGFSVEYYFNKSDGMYDDRDYLTFKIELIGDENG